MPRSRLPRLLSLAMLLVPLTACGGKEHILVEKPQLPAADLVVEAKPAMPEAAITDDTASALYSSDVEAWGDRGWATVGRICRWAATNKMTNVICPPSPGK